jgi:hypothetical protein
LPVPVDAPWQKCEQQPAKHRGYAPGSVAAQKDARMNNLELLETLQVLGGQEPRAGEELTLQGERYRVMGVTPPAAKPASKWRRKPVSTVALMWRLLVQRVA